MPLRSSTAAAAKFRPDTTTGMFRFVPRSRRSWRRMATAVAGALAANLAYHVVFGQNGITAYGHKRAETLELASEQRRLQKENEFLHAHVDRLRLDPGAIEHQAREELHYTRPGEIIYTMPAAPKNPRE